MTTIAYKDGILAADTAGTLSSGDWEGTVEKLARSPAGSIAASCGSASCCALFRALTRTGAVDEWLDQGRRDGNVLRPLELHLHPGEAFGALYIHYTSVVYAIGDRAMPYTYKALFYAEGSGHEYAKGAMSAGASAEEAVRVAAIWDHSTNDEVQTLKLKGG